jgi:hypothetical protein
VAEPLPHQITAVYESMLPRQPLRFLLADGPGAGRYLDDVPLWRGDNVGIRQLVDDFARYLYLPRLAGPDVLAQTIRDGIGLLTWRSDTFAYAESYDEAASRYRGLRGGLRRGATAR